MGQVVTALFTATGHQNFFGFVVESIVPLEFFYDGFFQSGGAVHRRVFGEPVLYSFNRGIFDVAGCIEIRLAGTQADDVLAGGTHLGGTCRDGQGRGGFDGLNAGGKLDTHYCESGIFVCLVSEL